MEAGNTYAINDGEHFGQMVVFLGGNGNRFFNLSTSDVVTISSDEIAVALSMSSRSGRPVLDFVEKLPDEVFEVVSKNCEGKFPKPFKLLQGRGISDPYRTVIDNAYAKKNYGKK